MQYGKCTNFDNCEYAVQQDIFEVPDGDLFQCPLCNKELVKTTLGNSASSGRMKRIIIGAIATVSLSLVCGLLGFAIAPHRRHHTPSSNISSNMSSSAASTSPFNAPSNSSRHSVPSGVAASAPPSPGDSASLSAEAHAGDNSRPAIDQSERGDEPQKRARLIADSEQEYNTGERPPALPPIGIGGSNRQKPHPSRNADRVKPELHRRNDGRLLVGAGPNRGWHVPGEPLQSAVARSSSQ